jgi:5,10-methylenetetrahydromethanopterin reductase
VTRFGIQLHGTFPMADYPALARAVESYDVFGELTVHDVLWWRPVWPILTLVAASTERVLVGPDVTHPYLRHPADTAANIAGLDELSGGRAILGLGAGSLLAPLGIRSERPVTAVRECAELVQRLLALDRAPYEGELFHAGAEAVFNWQPPRPRVPTFVGAFGPRMVESAAAWADEIRPPGQWAVPFFTGLKERAEQAAAAAGNERLRVGCDVWLSLDEDRSRARELGRRLLAQFVPSLAAMHELHGIGADEVEPVAERLRAGDRDGAAAAVSDRLLDTYVAAGDADHVRAGIERLVEAGAATITFSGRLGPDPKRALELLATRVLPELATTTEEEETNVRLP